MLPLAQPNIGIASNAWAYVKHCLDTGWVSYAGEYVNTFEKLIRDYTGAKYAIATNSGTSALHISLLLAGVEPGDKVAVPTITFAATVNAIKYCGGVPVFIGCDDQYNMSYPALARAIKAEDIKTVVPVHVFGTPVEHRIFDLCKDNGIKVVEDAAQGLGSTYLFHETMVQKHVGTIGDFGCFSFSFNKMITCGTGGMIVTDNEELAERARYLTTTAKDDAVRYKHDEVGYNYRMTNLNAAIGISQMELLEEFLKTKHKNLMEYWRVFPSMFIPNRDRGSHLVCPNCWFYALQLPEDIDSIEVIERLKEKGIQSRPLWYPNHLQKHSLDCKYYGSWDDPTMDLWERTINLPSDTTLTKDQVREVSYALDEILNGI